MIKESEMKLSYDANVALEETKKNSSAMSDLRYNIYTAIKDATRVGKRHVDIEGDDISSVRKEIVLGLQQDGYVVIPIKISTGELDIDSDYMFTHGIRICW